MKNPFRKSPMQKLETNLAALAERGDQLAAKRIAAQSALENAKKVRQEALLSGDLDDQRALVMLQEAVDTSISALAGIDDALAALAQQKTAAEKTLAAERERVARAKASEEINAATDGVDGRIGKLLSSTRDIGAALMAVEHLSFEAGQLGRYLSNVSGEAEVALAFVLSDLRRLSDAVGKGHEPIPRAPRAPEPVAAPEPPPPTMPVFMLRSAHFRDHDGRRRFVGQWEDATMPVATAQRALSTGIAVPMTDPRRAQLRGCRGGDFDPRAADVVDLDAAETHQGNPNFEPDPILREANFRVIDRSAETRKGEISVTRF